MVQKVLRLTLLKDRKLLLSYFLSLCSIYNIGLLLLKTRRCLLLLACVRHNSEIGHMRSRVDGERHKDKQTFLELLARLRGIWSTGTVM